MVVKNSATLVLLVDGETHLGSYLKTSLQEVGFVVYLANNEQEALIQLQRFAVDLVLVDARLLERTGPALCKAMRACRDVPIIVLSSSKLPEDMMFAYLAGADDYIVKPFSLREVTVRIQRLAPYTRHRIGCEHVVCIDLGGPYGQENPHSTGGR